MKKLFFLAILSTLLLWGGVFVSAVTWDNDAYYKLDQSSGSVFDSALNGYDGNNNGATRSVTGKINSAFSFDGNNDDVNLTVLNGASIGEDWTISLWINPTANVTPQGGAFGGGGDGGVASEKRFFINHIHAEIRPSAGASSYTITWHTKSSICSSYREPD